MSVWCAAEIGAARALGSSSCRCVPPADGVRTTVLKAIQRRRCPAGPSGRAQEICGQTCPIDGTGGRGWSDDHRRIRVCARSNLVNIVFFGRKVEIDQIAELLRSPAKRTAPEFLHRGGFGCGKSSLVRAGVLPRIASEALFFPLPPMVPGTDPIGGLAREIAALIKNRHTDVDVRSLGEGGLDRVKDLANDLLLRGEPTAIAAFLVFIDQFEELLTQTRGRTRQFR